MGIKEVKAAFQDLVEPDFNTTLATMETFRNGGLEYQVLFFRVNDRNGAKIEVRSDPIHGSDDLVQAAKDTAMSFLINQKKQKQE